MNESKKRKKRNKTKQTNKIKEKENVSDSSKLIYFTVNIRFFMRFFLFHFVFLCFVFISLKNHRWTIIKIKTRLILFTLNFYSIMRFDDFIYIEVKSSDWCAMHSIWIVFCSFIIIIITLRIFFLYFLRNKTIHRKFI